LEKGPEYDGAFQAKNSLTGNRTFNVLNAKGLLR